MWRNKYEAFASFLIVKANEMYYLSALFGKELYMFRTDLLSIIRGLNRVLTAICIFHTNDADFKLMVPCILIQC